jgi:hypothetical protein
MLFLRLELMQVEYILPLETFLTTLPTDAKSEDIIISHPNLPNPICKPTSSPTNIRKSRDKKSKLRKRGWRWVMELIRSLIPVIDAEWQSCSLHNSSQTVEIFDTFQTCLCVCALLFCYHNRNSGAQHTVLWPICTIVPCVWVFYGFIQAYAI